MPRFASPAVRVQFFVSLVVALLSTVAKADAADAPPSILLSRQLAARAGVAVGDLVTLGTEADGTGAATFRVAGIYEPTPDPMRFTAQRLEAHMHLPDLLAMVGDPADHAARD